jgi:hypothetical protein
MKIGSRTYATSIQCGSALHKRKPAYFPIRRLAYSAFDHQAATTQQNHNYYIRPVTGARHIHECNANRLKVLQINLG